MRVVLLAGLVALVAACVPLKAPPPQPTAEQLECESGVKLVTDLRPDLNITRHECTAGQTACGPNAFGCSIFAGVDNPANLIQLSAQGAWTTKDEYAEGFTHEEGHEWDWNRIDGPKRTRFVEIVGAYTTEGFAEAFRETVYHIAGNLTLSQQQRADLCADVMPCSP